jgi:hypothetical protein
MMYTDVSSQKQLNANLLLLTRSKDPTFQSWAAGVAVRQVCGLPHRGLNPFKSWMKSLDVLRHIKCKQPSGLACRALVMVVAVTSGTCSVKCARGKDRLHPLFDS